MEEFVAYIIKNLVSVPEGVNVSSHQDGDRLKIEIRVDQEDVGKIIGRKGNTINALRTIVRTVATRLGQRVQVELIQEEGEPEEVMSASPEEVENECTACEQPEEVDAVENECTTCEQSQEVAEEALAAT